MGQTSGNTSGKEPPANGEPRSRMSRQLLKIRARLRELADTNTAKVLQSFFKTGSGEYGEGDVFLGIKVPPLRILATEFEDATYGTLKTLLTSKIHEERTLALMVLVRQFDRGSEERREQVYKLYLAQTRFINN